MDTMMQLMMKKKVSLRTTHMQFLYLCRHLFSMKKIYLTIEKEFYIRGRDEAVSKIIWSGYTNGLVANHPSIMGLHIKSISLYSDNDTDIIDAIDIRSTKYLEKVRVPNNEFEVFL